MEDINVVIPDPKIFFWIAVFVADAAAVNSNGKKMILANGLSTFFINDKSAAISCLRKLINPPSRLLLFLVVPFYKIALFSKDLINFMRSFISLFV